MKRAWRMVGGVAVGAALTLTGGCGDSGESENLTAAAPSSTAASASASVSVDAAVCAELKAVHLQHYVRFDEQWKKLLKADDSALRAEVKAEKAIANEWAAALEPLIGKVEQPELRQPLAELLASVKQYAAGDGLRVGNLFGLAPTAMTAMSTRCPA